MYHHPNINILCKIKLKRSRNEKIYHCFEHAHNPGFADVSDGLWWAFVTLTTVGYGDLYSMTSGGRIVAVFTMLFGIAIYSLMIANLTYYIEETGRKRRELAEVPKETGSTASEEEKPSS